MKNGKNALALAAALLVLAAALWWGSASTGEESAASVTARFEVEGMTCGGCEAGVKAKVKKLDGVRSVAASYEEGTAVVVYDPTKLDPERIVAAIEELGYRARLAPADRV